MTTIMTHRKAIIATARKAIKTALKKGQINLEASAMHRVAIAATSEMHHNQAVIADLAWYAIRDVYRA